MTYLVDSDYVADYLKGRLQVVNTLKTILAEIISSPMPKYMKAFTMAIIEWSMK